MASAKLGKEMRAVIVRFLVTSEFVPPSMQDKKAETQEKKKAKLGRVPSGEKFAGPVEGMAVGLFLAQLEAADYILVSGTCQPRNEEGRKPRFTVCYMFVRKDKVSELNRTFLALRESMRSELGNLTLKNVLRLKCAYVNPYTENEEPTGENAIDLTFDSCQPGKKVNQLAIEEGEVKIEALVGAQKA
jgi:hypothetical protein